MKMRLSISWLGLLETGIHCINQPVVFAGNAHFDSGSQKCPPKRREKKMPCAALGEVQILPVLLCFMDPSHRWKWGPDSVRYSSSPSALIGVPPVNGRCGHLIPAFHFIKALKYVVNAALKLLQSWVGGVSWIRAWALCSAEFDFRHTLKQGLKHAAESGPTESALHSTESGSRGHAYKASGLCQGVP